MPSRSISSPPVAAAAPVRACRTRRRASAILGGAFACLALSGCARAVLPSEKAYLADPIMQFDVDGLEAACDGHMFMNREGSAGGTGTSGGGCGCN